jgi:hypothetical protein
LLNPTPANAGPGAGIPMQTGLCDSDILNTANFLDYQRAFASSPPVCRIPPSKAIS